MALVFQNTLANNLAGFASIEANGQYALVSANPSGLPPSLYLDGERMVSAISDTDPLTFGGQRAEITITPEVNGAHCWYKYEFMLAEDWDFNYPINIQQVHQSPDGGDPVRSENFVMYVAYGRIYLVIPTMSGNTSLSKKDVCVGEAIPGQWYECVLHCTWTKTATGVREFFVNRARVYADFDVQTHYDDVVGPYFKLGVYNHQHIPTYGERKCFYRNVKVFDGQASYLDVMGGNPRPASKFQLSRSF